MNNEEVKKEVKGKTKKEVVVETNVQTEPPVADIETKPIEPAKKLRGVVENCQYLRVRQEPNLNSAILTVLKQKSKVTIDITASTNEFYKVFVNDSIEGFCLKKFIKTI